MAVGRTTPAEFDSRLVEVLEWARGIARGVTPIDNEVLLGQTVGYVANLAEIVREQAVSDCGPLLTAGSPPTLLRDDALSSSVSEFRAAVAEDLADTRTRCDAEHGWAVAQGLLDLVELVGRLDDKVGSLCEALETAGIAQRPACSCMCSRSDRP